MMNKIFVIVMLGSSLAWGGLLCAGCASTGASPGYGHTGYPMYRGYPYYGPGWGPYPPPYSHRPGDRPDNPDSPNPERPIHRPGLRPPDNIGRPHPVPVRPPPRPTPRPLPRPRPMPRAR